jgi:hypothetical protein
MASLRIQQFIYWRQSCPVDPIFNVCINGLNAVLYDDIWEEAAHNTNATDRTRNISIYISTSSTLPTMVRWFRGDSRGIFSLESYRRKPGSRALQPTAMRHQASCESFLGLVILSVTHHVGVFLSLFLVMSH